MMMRSRLCWLVLVGAAMLITAAAQAQEKKDAEAKGPAAQGAMNEEMMAWMKAGMLNENHERLNDMIGEWTCSLKMWQPGMSPMESSGTCKNEWILEKHYMRSVFTGDFMGMPYEGAGITGYDNVTKQYFSTWMDTMSTMMQTKYGQYDEKARTYNYTSEFDGPMGDKVYTRSQTKVFSKNKHVMTAHQGKDAKSMTKVMEITFERKSVGKKTASAMMTVEAGCGSCIFKMPGVEGCKLAVKIDGKPYLVTGADVDAHKAGLCQGAKQATCSGEIKDDTFVATSFELVK